MYLTYKENGYSLGRVMKFMNEQFGYELLDVEVKEDFSATVFKGECNKEVIKLLVKSLYRTKVHPVCNSLKVFAIYEESKLFRSAGGSLTRSTCHIIGIVGGYDDNKLVTIRIGNVKTIRVGNEMPEDYIPFDMRLSRNV